MAYQTGSATDGTDLLKTLVTWLVSIGWTTDLSAIDGGGWRAHLHKGGLFVHMKSHFFGDTTWVASVTTDGYALQLYLSSAFNGSQPFNAQPGAPPYISGSSSQVVGCGAHLPAGAITNYYFFSDTPGDHIIVVVEITPGVYVHFGWGSSLVKNGTWTGGAYFFASSSGMYASYPYSGVNTPGFTSTARCPGAHEDYAGLAAGFVLCDSDSFTGKWIGLTDSTVPNAGYTGRNGASMVTGDHTPTPSIPRYSSADRTFTPPMFQFEQTSQLDGRASLLPIVWWVGRDGSSGAGGGFSPIGSIPNIFFSNGVGNGFAPIEDYALGADTFTMFPDFAVRKIV